MTDIKVAVNGALGRMGFTVLNAVEQEDGMIPVGGVDIQATTSQATIDTDSGTQLPLAKELSELFKIVKPDVVVDFTNAEGAATAMRTCINHGVRCVSGSTGLNEQELHSIGELASQHRVGIISASNFALGCVVLMHLARAASQHFDYADIIESHHEQKIDAPSGTALSIASAMIEGKGSDFNQNTTEKEILSNTRGGSINGINIHSARMPGRVARHEVVFGAVGQTLTIIHDSISRESFMPGVMLAIRRVMQEKNMIIGLDSVLGLKH